MLLEPPDKGKKAARHPHRPKVDDLLSSIESGGDDADGQEPASPVAATVGVDADLGIVNVLREAERGAVGAVQRCAVRQPRIWQINTEFPMLP